MNGANDYGEEDEKLFLHRRYGAIKLNALIFALSNGFSTKLKHKERKKKKDLTNPILKRVFFFRISSNCFILPIGIQWSQRIYWMIFTGSLSTHWTFSFFLFRFLFLIVDTFIFTWPSPFERIHDSQNTYPIKFRLSARCRCHSFNCMEMAGRMDSWET